MRLTSPTTSVVSFSHLSAATVLRQVTQHVNVFGLRQPQTLCQAFI